MLILALIVSFFTFLTATLPTPSGPIPKLDAVSFDLKGDFSLFTVNPISTKCLNKIQSTLNHFQSDPTFFNILSYSGKGLNDLGDYLSCNQNRNQYYYLLLGIDLAWLSTLKIGLCVPNDCHIAVLEEFKPAIARTLSNIYNVTLSPSQIFLNDPASKNSVLNSTTSGLVIFLLGIGIIGLVVILATVMYYQKITKNKLIQCFSLERNAQSLFSSENRIDKKLDVLNGVRVLGIFWVIVGHSFFTFLSYPLQNMEELLNEMIHGRIVGMIKAGTMAVDIFFFLSGFLAFMSLYRTFKERKNWTFKNIILTYMYRYARLFPVLAVSILYTIYVQPTLYDTPISTSSEDCAEDCKSQWYQTLLFYNNFASDFNHLCNPWVWYLCVDMQLFIISPWVVICYCWDKVKGVCLILLICVTSIAAKTILCAYYDFNLSIIKYVPDPDRNNMVYVKPYFRLVPYFMGMLLYLLYRDDHSKLRNLVTTKKLIRYPMYVLGISLIVALVYSFYYLDEYPDRWGNLFGVFHMVISRPGFILGLCLLLYPVLIGRGKLLLSVLGHPMFSTLSKLTYGTYMVHLPLFSLCVYGTLQARVYSAFDATLAAIMMLCLSYAVSFVLTIIFESPMVQLLKMLLESQRRSGDTKALHSKQQGEDNWVLLIKNAVVIIGQGFWGFGVLFLHLQNIVNTKHKF
eukprot:TRINITY_DN136437_c0_g1_i1.p1 TRINITY_DN136437_c0_g1~~TRINITY_DN136437_c0_g1_i1.p1  ORF type:complete len:684 (+),score=13.42 TRINITY_DN136437_c0_g1_i1:110-2161(+)